MTESPISLPQPIEAPVALFKRNEDGLVIGFPYRFTPEGRVDWLALIPRKHMFVIREREADVVKAQGKPLAECDLALVNEKWLRIRQAGFNYVLNLRGYRSLQYHSLSAASDKAAVICEVELIPNFETDGYSVICSGVASASLRSMDKHFIPYLETFAENRAFARCVKRALQITILSEDEIDAEAVGGVKGEDDTVSEAASGGISAEPHRQLEELCTKRKHPIAFDALRARAVQHNAELTPERENERIKSDPAQWTDWSSVQPIDAWLLMGKIKERDDAERAAKKGSK